MTAFFDNEADAEAAVARIAAEGVPRDQIRIVAGTGDADMTAVRAPREGLLRALADLSCRKRTATPMPKV